MARCSLSANYTIDCAVTYTIASMVAHAIVYAVACEDIAPIVDADAVLALVAGNKVGHRHSFADHDRNLSLTSGKDNAELVKL